ncbi:MULTISPECIES: nucleoside triphosphate pyrophosphohydrolase [unclassified Halomonas]|uniref:nucleoside triphosphate pyrophosphohydrolase n=1 Tax=unclassified Halomonas TaxID=2609666 RepID=UPI0021E40521|nr:MULTISPECIES: nucleoside triphosphate pyrophosphohydrolase [unclassified Halomonas]UYG01474.1 nucleoside triphosphate pyrophosphohydrolase [Halomonas sp. GD1P12]WNL37469.1 nucleoside triphosphate pyrophosphohydrolase [Halomonas sp. PAMB 3232]WNL40782.1 nucleoside triphosphate pyrophosphohydrolase [Halomonas sp. PAMB 3264]
MRYELADLLELMRVLRDPEQGCPWDVEQRWDTIVPHTIEEAYEVADAIERRAFDELPGELGDLLFQIVYYAQFGLEEQRFDFFDVVDTLTRKMIRRHPHVFPEGTLASRRAPGESADEVEQRQVKHRWEALKDDERNGRAIDNASTLDDVPKTLPALSRAHKLSKRAARVGFDWPDTRGVLDKIREELGEVEEALAANDTAHAREEVGDLLFAVANLARTLDADPETCLRATNAKFERRFRYVERALNESQRSMSNATLNEMERHWQAAKRQERS